MVVTPELLSFFPLLRSLAPTTLAQLAQQAVAHKHARRAVVLDAGIRGDHVCFLFEGRLQGVDFTVDGREVGLYFVEPGDFCGEVCLFDDGPQPEYVIVLSPAVPLAALRTVMLDNPLMVNTLGERLARRLRQMTYQRSLLGMPSIPQRVCCQLWLLVPTADRERLQASEIRNPPTHMEIAIMLNLSRETVTRVFQTLQTREIVKRDGSARLVLSNLSALKALAEGTAEL
jgi:CRP/FNR family transcriptional regulator, cyclic AMP receptor protein